MVFGVNPLFLEGLHLLLLKYIFNITLSDLILYAIILTISLALYTWDCRCLRVNRDLSTLVNSISNLMIQGNESPIQSHTQIKNPYHILTAYIRHKYLFDPL